MEGAKSTERRPSHSQGAFLIEADRLDVTLPCEAVVMLAPASRRRAESEALMRSETPAERNGGPPAHALQLANGRAQIRGLLNVDISPEATHTVVG